MGWPAPSVTFRVALPVACVEKGANHDHSDSGDRSGQEQLQPGALDATGVVVLRRRLSRAKVAEFVSRLPACVVAMEACCGAHHLGRLFVGQGHEVRLMAPEYVQPYVKAQKNDDRDAEAIAEAATRPTMRFVALKAEAQLDQQTLHRAVRAW